MNKKQKIFSFSMILILLVAISIPVDAAIRTTIINPNVKTGYVNNVFLNYPKGQNYPYSELSIYQRSEINKLIHGQIDTERIKDIKLGSYLSGFDDKPVIITAIDDNLEITSIDDKYKEKFYKVLPMPSKPRKVTPANKVLPMPGKPRKVTPAPRLPPGSGPDGPSTPPPTLHLSPTPVKGDLTELMRLLNQTRYNSLESEIFKDYMFIRADVLSTPTPSSTVKPTATSTSTPTPTPPGFELLFAMIGVVAAMCLVRRRGHV